MTNNDSYVAEDALLTTAAVTVTAVGPAEAFRLALGIVDVWAAHSNLTVACTSYTVECVGKSLRKGEAERFRVTMS